MIRFNPCLFLVLFINCQSIFGQVTSAFIETKYTIPFQLTEYNNISVQAKLNQKDTINLMFHTAANAVSLTEEGVKKIKTITFAGADSVSSWGGGGNSSRFSKGNSLQLGALNWTNVSIWENKNSGPKTDGKFGIDLFAGQVIELDFDKNQLILYTSLPEKSKKFEKLKLYFEDDFMFIEANCKIENRSLTNRFLIHSGYSGALLFDDTFVSKNKIDENLEVISEKELKDSFGNSVKTKRAILPIFIIGHNELTDVPVGFFTGKIGNQKVSILGGDLLKRFNIIIDEKREYIYISPNKLRKSKYFSS
ncbi:aspartyl protease family protein [Spirosoma sp. BT702]|uniref:Aspartyl protease family protein n=1 Tax=Spirosoma profusum TaxID=2771354 RepID=A0A926XT06_9BACT|nr:aspartyl protease family protein [Spirosoma profusum]MBD2699039.1 aspartyl protease family protein [Spirosoma profusum]